MTAPLVGGKVRVNYAEKGGFSYIFYVTVLEVDGSGQILGRVESIFSISDGEITGGDILAMKGQSVAFGIGDLISGGM